MFEILAQVSTETNLSLIETFKKAFAEPTYWTSYQIIVAIGLSLIASIAIYIAYQIFYASNNIGAGVDRTFIIAGPAITALFIGIQTSIPLSLGLLGALSFIRFRTPVKDPAEIGYLLVLIATSIGAATQTYLIAVILFIVVVAALCIQWYIREGLSFPTRTNLMISIDKDLYAEIEPKLTQFLQKRLDNLTLKTVSVQDNRVSLHYQHKKTSNADKIAFVTDIHNLAAPGSIEFFAG
jgi:hypothetical protein